MVVPPLSYSDEGAAVAAVTPQSPAALAGVQQGDLLLSLDERTIRGVGDLMAGLPRTSIGTELRLRMLRHNEILRTTVRPVVTPSAAA